MTASRRLSIPIALPCHQNRRPTRAGVNFSPALKAPGHAAFTEQWKKADARVKAHDMPPKGAPQPDDADRRMFADWLAKLKYLSDKDPGPFVIRRLTKTEYGNTLHDLFGVDPSIADGLPDEVSGEGYLNSLSPLQLEQYLTIADKVLRRIVAPQGAPAHGNREAAVRPICHAGERSPASGAGGRPVSGPESLPPATDGGGAGCPGGNVRPGKAEQIGLPAGASPDAQGRPRFSSVPVYYAGSEKPSRATGLFRWTTTNSPRVCPICYGLPCLTMN